MSKEVGAGGRFDIFLDSAIYDERTGEEICYSSLTFLFS